MSPLIIPEHEEKSVVLYQKYINQPCQDISGLPTWAHKTSNRLQLWVTRHRQGTRDQQQEKCQSAWDCSQAPPGETFPQHTLPDDTKISKKRSSNVNHLPSSPSCFNVLQVLQLSSVQDSCSNSFLGPNMALRSLWLRDSKMRKFHIWSCIDSTSMKVQGVIWTKNRICWLQEVEYINNEGITIFTASLANWFQDLNLERNVVAHARNLSPKLYVTTFRPCNPFYLPNTCQKCCLEWIFCQTISSSWTNTRQERTTQSI